MKNTKLLGLGSIFALPPDALLGEKLGAVSALELGHGILGVSIRVESGQRVLTRECIDDVLGAITAGIALMERADTIPSLADLLEQERRGAFEVP